MTNSANYPLLTPSFRANRLQWLSGSHDDLRNDYQLLLIIQPNCPGCLAHAIPVANAIAKSTADFDTYCVSTAFEDFEFNNVHTARALLHGNLVGSAADKLSGMNSFDTTAFIPHMPFAHDHVINRKDADSDFKEWVLSVMIESARQQLQSMRFDEERIESILQGVSCKILPEELAELFWSVKAEGSPTWVIHKRNGEVLDVRFGYMDEKQICQWVGKLVPASFYLGDSAQPFL